MVHKLHAAETRLDTYRVNMDVQEKSLDTTVSDTDLAITIIILSVIGGLIFLNLTFYVICRRITRLKLKVHDMEITIPSQSPSMSRDDILEEEDDRVRSESQTELRCCDASKDPRRSYSESYLTNCHY